MLKVTGGSRWNTFVVIWKHTLRTLPTSELLLPSLDLERSEFLYIFCITFILLTVKVSDDGDICPLHCDSDRHTHTHLFNCPLSGTTQVSRHQKGKINLDFTEARDSEWQWHQLGHMQVCTSLQTDNHASTPPLSFLQVGCPCCRPTNSVKALKAMIVIDFRNICYFLLLFFLLLTKNSLLFLFVVFMFQFLAIR